jgi:hypothetical protein
MTRTTAAGLSEEQKLLRAIPVVDEARAHAVVENNGYELY